MPYQAFHPARNEAFFFSVSASIRVMGSEIEKQKIESGNQKSEIAGQFLEFQHFRFQLSAFEISAFDLL
jgi:hypothetical protein